MGNEDVESEHGFAQWARIVAGAVSLLMLLVGIVAIFLADGGVATAVLLAVAGVLGYVALANDRIREVSTSGVSFFQQESARVVKAALSSAETPTEVQEFLTRKLEPHHEEFPQNLRRDFREASDRVAGTKADLLGELCDQLEIPRVALGVGGSVPSRVFRSAAVAVGVPAQGSMPEVAGRIVEKAGLAWDAGDWSTGSTVTLSGLRKVVFAVRRLLE